MLIGKSLAIGTRDSAYFGAGFGGGGGFLGKNDEKSQAGDDDDEGSQSEEPGVFGEVILSHWN